MQNLKHPSIKSKFNKICITIIAYFFLSIACSYWFVELFGNNILTYIVPLNFLIISLMFYYVFWILNNIECPNCASKTKTQKKEYGKTIKTECFNCEIIWDTKIEYGAD